MPDTEPDGRGDELLLRDEHLEVALRVRLGELVRVRGVADFAVQRHDPGIGGADGDEGVAVGLARRDLVADGVRRGRAGGPRAPRCLRRRRGMRGRAGPRAADGQVALSAELGDRALGHVRREGPAVPAVLVLHFGEPAPLDRAGQYHRRLVAGRVLRGGQGLVDFGQVMPVDGQYPCAERLRPAGVGAQVPLQLGGPALAEAVDVDDRDQVGQLVVGGLVEGLPDGPFGHLAVPAQHPHPVRELVEVLAGQGDPYPVGEALAQGPGGDVHPRQVRRGVALEPGSEAPVPGHQLLVGHDPDRLVDRVEQRGGMALGEDQVVVGVIVRVVPVVAQVPADEHRQQVGGGHARGGMTGPGTRAGPDGINPELRGEFRGLGEVDPGKRLRRAGHV